jgi:molybdopterin synthase sulfur carrier subunit
MSDGRVSEAAPGAQPSPAGDAPVVTLRLFASAREAAGTGRAEVPGRTVTEVLDAARAAYGPAFGQILGLCRVWVNGDPVAGATEVHAGDEVAVLPPVSGGATA